MDQRRRHKVKSVSFLSRDTYSLSLERQDFTFKAGQCVNIGIPNSGVNREYSTYSPEGSETLSFLIRRVKDGSVSPKLCDLSPGDEVEIDGPYGEFCLHNPEPDVNYVFIGSGTGIAPFHCFVKSYPQISYTILHGVRHNEEQYDAADYKDGRYISCVSREDGGTYKGRVTDYLKDHPIDKDATYYLCGNRSMINDVYDLLRNAGVFSSRIFTETFF